MIVWTHLIKDEKHDQRANDGQDQAGGMKQSSVSRPRKQASDQAAKDRTDDPKQGRHQEIHVHMHDQTSNESGNEADNYIPDDV